MENLTNILLFLAIIALVFLCFNSNWSTQPQVIPPPNVVYLVPTNPVVGTDSHHDAIESQSYHSPSETGSPTPVQTERDRSGGQLVPLSTSGAILVGGQYVSTGYIDRPHWRLGWGPRWRQGHGWGPRWGRGYGWRPYGWRGDRRWPYSGNDSEYNTCRDYAEAVCASSPNPQYCIPYTFRACGGQLSP